MLSDILHPRGCGNTAPGIEYRAHAGLVARGGVITAVGDCQRGTELRGTWPARQCALITNGFSMTFPNSDQTPNHVSQTPDGSPAAPVGWPAGEHKKSGRSTALRIVIPIVSLLAAVGASFGVRALFQGPSEPSPAALATEAAKQVNDNYTFPLDVDDVTTWDEVSAHGAELTYNYTIDSSVDPNSVTKDDLRASVKSNVCQKEESRDLLSKAVVMRYSYWFDGTDRTIDFTITAGDC